MAPPRRTSKGAAPPCYSGGMTAGRRAIERSLLLAAGPARVWAALASPAAWLCDRAAGDPLELTWDLPGRPCAVRARVVESEPSRRFAFRWPAVGADEVQASFFLSAEGHQTRLVLVESGFGDGPLWDLALEEHVEGWDEALRRLARLLGAAEERRIVKEALLPAPPARVFEALTSEGELRAWLSGDARFEPRPGSSYRLADPGWGGGGRGRVVDVRGPRELALTWHWDPELPPTELRVALSDEAVEGRPVTRLVLDHGAWGPGPEFNRAIEEMDEGWEDVLFLLRRHLARRGSP